MPRGLGSPPYLAPEQARGETAGAATDIWGIGVPLYEAATGTRPFPDASSVAEGRRAPAAFARLVDGCLSPDPSERPSVEELADELDAVIGP